MQETWDIGLVPRLGISPGEGNGYPLQYSWLENSMDRGAWWATVHGVTKSQTQSILKEINPEYSLEGLKLKVNTLATWSKQWTHWKRPWYWKKLKAEGDGDNRGRDHWRASLTQRMWVWAKLQEMVKDREAWQSMGLQSRARLSNWTTTDGNMAHIKTTVHPWIH